LQRLSHWHEKQKTRLSANENKFYGNGQQVGPQGPQSVHSPGAGQHGVPRHTPQMQSLDAETETGIGFAGTTRSMNAFSPNLMPYLPNSETATDSPSPIV